MRSNLKQTWSVRSDARFLFFTVSRLFDGWTRSGHVTLPIHVITHVSLELWTGRKAPLAVRVDAREWFVSSVFENMAFKPLARAFVLEVSASGPETHVLARAFVVAQLKALHLRFNMASEQVRQQCLLTYIHSLTIQPQTLAFLHRSTRFHRRCN